MMDDKELTRARWATFAALLICFSSYSYFSFDQNIWVSGAIGLATSSLLTAVLEIWLRLSLRRAMGGERFAEARRKLDDARQQTQTALDLQRKLLEAHSEKEILEALLACGASTLRAGGVSFVPYNEWSQTLPTLFQGEVPQSALQSWASRLSSPKTRQACKSCMSLHGQLGCALIPPDALESTNVHCSPLVSGEREVGVVNFFFDAEPEIDSDTRAFIADAMALAGQALQNLRVRDQEIAALRYLQTASTPKAELSVLLKSLLENVHNALDVDFALLYLPDGFPGSVDSPAPLLLTEPNGGDNAAESAIPSPAFLDGIWKSVLSSGQSLSLENVALNKREKWTTLLALPLAWHAETPAGMLVLGSRSNQTFAQRQALLEALASQAALLIQNASLVVQVEYQAVVDERTRLAREIHDGLAQTLAFLKIQAAQMQNYLADGKLDRLTNTLQANYRTLSDAYLDARQAIDNLRRMPSASLQGWVRDVAEDFEHSAGVKVDLSKFELKIAFPPIVQAQLIRIVQEALNNVRKHARAQMVEIVGRQDGDQVLIQVRDDGLGFSPELVDSSLRYGLRGMQERAEMIGADFQITSQPGRGTNVSLRLLAPLKEAA
jgi:two-component system nitrate/nitrite sensor histidine kinase NarX